MSGQAQGRSRDEDSPEEILRSTRQRLEIFDALVAAVDHRDEVVAIVAASASQPTAVARLVELLKVTPTGASSVLEMQLRRLVPSEADRIRAEHAELRRMIARLEAGEQR